MSGKSKFGFTFIELMIVILILGLVATLIVPNLQQRLPGYKRKAFVNELNTLLALGWQSALINQKVILVFFDLKKRLVSLKTEEPGPANTVVQKPLTQAYRKTWYEWPETIQIKNFFIDGIDDMSKPGQELLTIWFYIVPEGLSQEVIINVLDTSQTPNIPLGLVLNPFTAQLKKYDTFQKP
jgi:prepilin-type N-terminal cleavage/methylation domain-containing protein